MWTALKVRAELGETDIALSSTETGWFLNWFLNTSLNYVLPSCHFEPSEGLSPSVDLVVLLSVQSLVGQRPTIE